MNNDLQKLAKLIRYYILVSTTEAGSGHPTSSLSAADLMAVLMFGGHFKFDLDNPEYPNNDRLIFSKGHASPLFYSIYAAAGKVSEKEMLSLRKFGSPLEGHPMPAFKYTEVPTGSLGQGLSVGVGMALNAKLDGLSYRTFVLLGDSEMTEGSVWEALALASHYHLNNLIAVLDVNRLGQRGETLHGHNVASYQKKVEAFGWQTEVIDGHNLDEISSAFAKATADNVLKPAMIIARTLKGKGVSFIEDKDGWHGKPLSREELHKALQELGNIDKSMIGKISKAAKAEFPISLPRRQTGNFQFPINVPISNYPIDKPVATRKAYGNALVNLVEANPKVVVLDAEVSNSTYSELVRKSHPEKFIECFVAEQNMVGMASGLSRRGKIPFISTFAAFFTRAFDQIRMSQYAKANLKFCGSHAGVSIGEDGSSQMGLEDIAMFRTLLDSVVLYPCDAISTEKLVWEAAKHFGNVYIQTTRKETPILYSSKYQVASIKEEESLTHHEFKIGGSCVLRSSDNDRATVIAAGITVHEALKTYEELKKEGINVRVVDLYSVKPIDIETLKKAAEETKHIITVEDSYPEGGIGEAVAATLSQILNIKFQISNLAVRKVPKSGKPDELLAYEGIDSSAIIKKIKELL